MVRFIPSGQNFREWPPRASGQQPLPCPSVTPAKCDQMPQVPPVPRARGGRASSVPHFVHLRCLVRTLLSTQAPRLELGSQPRYLHPFAPITLFHDSRRLPLPPLVGAHKGQTSVSLFSQKPTGKKVTSRFPRSCSSEQAMSKRALACFE